MFRYAEAIKVMIALTEKRYNPNAPLSQASCESCRRLKIPCTHIEPEHLSLETLVRECKFATSAFIRGRFSDERFGYELFRRALDKQEELAWLSLVDVYNPLVSRWAKSHPSLMATFEDADYFVNRAFERLWRNVATQPGKFAKFANLKSILRFLKLCVHSAVMDDAPKSPPTRELEMVVGDEKLEVEISVPFKRGEDAQKEFWQVIDKQLRSEEERVVMYGFFVYGMKNREIYAENANLFKDTKQLANLRLNVLRRLARLPQFEQVLRDLIEDNFDSYGAGLSC